MLWISPTKDFNSVCCSVNCFHWKKTGLRSFLLQLFIGTSTDYFSPSCRIAVYVFLLQTRLNLQEKKALYFLTHSLSVTWFVTWPHKELFWYKPEGCKWQCRKRKKCQEKRGKKSYISFGTRVSSVPFKRCCFSFLCTSRTNSKNKYINSGSAVLFFTGIKFLIYLRSWLTIKLIVFTLLKSVWSKYVPDCFSEGVLYEYD